MRLIAGVANQAMLGDDALGLGIGDAGQR